MHMHLHYRATKVLSTGREKLNLKPKIATTYYIYQPRGVPLYPMANCLIMLQFVCAHP